MSAAEHQRKAAGVEFVPYRFAERVLRRFERIAVATDVAAVGQRAAIVHRDVAQCLTYRGGTTGRADSPMVACDAGVAGEAQQHRRGRAACRP